MAVTVYNPNKYKDFTSAAQSAFSQALAEESAKQRMQESAKKEEETYRRRNPIAAIQGMIVKKFNEQGYDALSPKEKAYIDKSAYGIKEKSVSPLEQLATTMAVREGIVSPEEGKLAFGGGEMVPEAMTVGGVKYKRKPTQQEKLAEAETKGLVKEKEAIAKEKAEGEILAPRIKRLSERYLDAKSAAEKKIPGLGQPGVIGMAKRKGADVLAAFGALPEVKQYQRNIAAFATTVAKAAGEVRPTDEDIQRFVKTLMNVTGNTEEENQLQMRWLIEDLEDRGINTDWATALIGGAMDQASQEVDLSQYTDEELMRIAQGG